MPFYLSQNHEWPICGESDLCAPFPSQLLHASAQLAREAKSIFLSANTFRLCSSDLDGLLPLLSLPSGDLSLMTRLCICIDTEGRKTCSHRMANDWFYYPSGMSASADPDQLLENWASLCRYVLAPKSL